MWGPWCSRQQQGNPSTTRETIFITYYIFVEAYSTSNGTQVGTCFVYAPNTAVISSWFPSACFFMTWFVNVYLLCFFPQKEMKWWMDQHTSWPLRLQCIGKDKDVILKMKCRGQRNWTGLNMLAFHVANPGSTQHYVWSPGVNGKDRTSSRNSWPLLAMPTPKCKTQDALSS